MYFKIDKLKIAYIAVVELTALNTLLLISRDCSKKSLGG